MKTAGKIGLAIIAVYLLALNGLINSSYLKSQINTWQDGHLEWDYALCLLPGRVTVWNARLRHQDENVQWTAYLEHIGLSIELLPLIDSRFTVSAIQVNGARFHLRFRKAERLAQKVASGILPPFEKFVHEKVPTRPGDQSPPWSVSMREIKIADLNEIWFGEYHYRGPAQITGEFQIEAKTWAKVGPAALRLGGGNLKLGNLTVADSLRGSIATTVHRFPATVETKVFPQYVDADLKLESSGLDLRFLNYYLRRMEWLRIAAARGPVKLNVGIRRGHLVAPSELLAEADLAGLQVRGGVLTGTSRVTFRVRESARGPEAKLAIAMKRLDMVVADSEWPVVEVGGCEIEATSRKLYLADGFPDLAIGLRFHDAVMQVPKALNPHLKAAGLTFESGKLHVEGEWKGVQSLRADSGWIRAELRQIGGSFLSMPFQSSGRVTARFSRSSMRQGIFHATETAVDLEGTNSESSYQLSTWFDPGAVLKLSPFNLTGRAHLRADSGDGFFEDVLAKIGVPNLAMRVVSLERIDGDVAVNIKPERALVELSRAMSGAVRLKGESYPREGKSLWLLWVGPFSLGLEVQRESKHLVLHEAEAWYLRRVAAE